MTRQRLKDIISRFSKKRILVVGDIMLDKYIWGTVDRISPEAPVQVVNVTRENSSPGAGANVAANLASLGAKVSLLGLAGEDKDKDILLAQLSSMDIVTGDVICTDQMRTIVKVRIIGQSQQLLRVDYEKQDFSSEKIEKLMISKIRSMIDEFDAVVISDYAKGAITENVVLTLVGLCSPKFKIIVVDPKPKHISFYKGVTLITPNHKEAVRSAEYLGYHGLSDDDIGSALIKELSSSILMTQGERGMTLYERSGTVRRISTVAKEVFDVTGAGDTAVATTALALAAHASPTEAAIIANHAAGIVVGKVGTATVTPQEIIKSIEEEGCSSNPAGDH